MRLDKYLKVSRLIKRRTVAKEMVDAGRVKVNDKPAKPGTEVKVGDVLEIGFGQKATKAEILVVKETVRAEEARELYRLISGEEIE
ncbi:MAG: RNA-binding S4 domain-containing protein [Peptococcaceae bacterium]|nr:RNA-binding S4 domain-containing protein [Peptococcaceae bacterium]